MIPVIGICGASGSGKTWLIERLLPLIKAQGIKVGVLKHHGHGEAVPTPGRVGRQGQRPPGPGRGRPGGPGPCRGGVAGGPSPGRGRPPRPHRPAHGRPGAGDRRGLQGRGHPQDRGGGPGGGPGVAQRRQALGPGPPERRAAPRPACRS